MYMYICIYIYIYIIYILYIHRHVFRRSQDSSVWLWLTSGEQLMSSQCSKHQQKINKISNQEKYTENINDKEALNSHDDNKNNIRLPQKTLS